MNPTQDPNIKAFNAVQTQQNTGQQYSTGLGVTPNSAGLNSNTNSATPQYAPAPTPAPIPTTITGSNTQNNQPYNLPTANTTTGTTGNLAANNATNIGAITTTATPAPTTTTTTTPTGQKGTLYDTLTKTVNDNNQQISDLQNDPEFIAKRDRARSIANELQAIDKTHLDNVAAIKQESGGTLAGQNDKLNQENYNYDNQRANVSIAYNTANGDYQSAQDTINAKVKSLQDANTQQFDLYKAGVDAINSDLTDSEKLQAQEQLSQKQAQFKATQDAYTTVMQNMSANNAPASAYNAVDTAAKDPNATPASIYAAGGTYNQTGKYSVVTNPLTGEQSAFDTRTGEFKYPGGQPIASNDLTNNPALATTTINNTKPIIQNGIVTHPPTGNIVVDTAQQLVDGNTIPSMIPRRGAAYNAMLAKANELSIAQTGKPYSAVDASAAYKFRTSSNYTKFISNAPVAISTINTIVNDVHALQDSGFNMNNIDLFNSYKLKWTASGLNPLATDSQRATAKELINTLGSISADDIGLLLGSGTGSDYKTKLGGAIFDVSGNLKSTDQIAQTVKDRIQAKLNDYYRIAGVSDPSIYSTKDTQAITDSSSNSSGSNGSSSTTGTNGQTVKSNSGNYTVGQVYQDGSGAQWTIDASGKWTKK